LEPAEHSRNSHKEMDPSRDEIEKEKGGKGVERRKLNQETGQEEDC